MHAKLSAGLVFYGLEQGMREPLEIEIQVRDQSTTLQSGIRVSEAAQ